MKTENIEQQLRDYYRDLKEQPSQTVVSEDIDDNLIARYIEGTATPEEIVQLEKHAETNEEIKILLQTLATQDLNEEITPHLTNVAHPEYSPREGVPACSAYAGEGRGGSNFKGQRSKVLNFFCLSHLKAISFLRCAACLAIIVTGSVFIVGKLKSSSNTSKPQITLRGGPSSTNAYQLPITNKNDKVAFKK